MKNYLTKTNIFCLIALFCFIYFVKSVETILLPFLLAFILAYILHPLVEKLVNHKWSKSLATSTVTLGFCVSVIAIFLIIIPLLQSQLISFMRQIPQFSASVWNYLKDVLVLTKENITSAQMAELSDAVSGSVMTILTAIGASLSHILSNGLAVFNILILIVITPVILLYVLKDWEEITMHIKKLIPPKKEEKVYSLWHEIDKTLSGYIRGQASVCLVLMIFYALGFSIIGLEFGILVGLLAGILSFIPYVGFVIGIILSSFLGLMQGFEMTQWLSLLALFIIECIFEGYFLTPKLVGKKVGLHPAWIIFALLAGGALFGFLGVLIAIPVAAVLGVLVRHGIQLYQKSSFYKGSTSK